MKTSIKFILYLILGLIIIGLIRDLMKSNSHTTSFKDSEYYLTSPWTMEKVDWFFIPLPEKWEIDKKELAKAQESYSAISNDFKIYSLKLKNFDLVCMYLDAKEGAYENWDLDKSAIAISNKALYNLKCDDILSQKNEPLDNLLEVNYSIFSNCAPNNYKARIKGLRIDNHILFIGTFFIDSDPNLYTIASRILNGVEIKYSDMTK
jgi:hypothetical protein